MNSIVYLYGFSPTIDDKIESLIDILKQQIILNIEINMVLIHDGVIGISRKAITPESIKQLLNLPVKVYAVVPDIKARGMDPNNLIDQVKGIEYEDLVDILATTHKIISWM